jgi:uncharacterized RDD family membrane protein YckC
MKRETTQLVTLRVLAFAIDALGMLFLLILPATLISYAIVFTLDTTTAVAKVWQTGLAIFVGAILLRDWRGGRSPGKRILGLVITTPSGRGCGLVRSIVRNVPLVIPGWNLIELVALLANRSTRRSGDWIARTTVEQE